MSLEQQVTALVEASNNLTSAVNGKIGQIDQRMVQAEQEFQVFQDEVKKLIPAINLLPDPGFQSSTVGAGAPSPYTLATIYGSSATIEVAELTEQDKDELEAVLGNSNAFRPSHSSAFWPSNLLPRKVVITQTVEGTSSTSLRFQCHASHIMGKPLYMELVKMGAFTKKSGKPWQFGPVSGMFVTDGDIDDNQAFSIMMNGVTVWEIFLPFLTFESNEMVYSNVGGSQ
ncbi:hypothetical protein ACT21L_004423 [Vibrio vulnificus]